MRFASLGSGSQGNALLVQSGRTCVMVDCGFSLRETVGRLERIGCRAEDVDAVVVTHEHDDHVGGVARFAGHYGIPVYLTPGTLAAMGSKFGGIQHRCFDPHTPFELADLRIEPFPVPHDAREPAQLVFDDGRCRIGVLTDVGAPTPHIRAMLAGCHALLLECNHDAALLREGPYPPSLKARIGSRVGHMSNADAAQLLESVKHAKLRHVVAAHLSEANNTPRLAKAALAAALGACGDEVMVATQEDGFGWLGLD